MDTEAYRPPLLQWGSGMVARAILSTAVWTFNRASRFLDWANDEAMRLDQ